MFHFVFLSCLAIVASAPDRIVGGDQAPEAYAPHMVALIRGAPVISMSCGGSIISSKLVLTAAHCIDPFMLENGSLVESFHGRVGSNYWRTNGGTTVYFSQYYIHPQWDEADIKYDAGILVLQEDLVFNDYVQPIVLKYEFVGETRTFVTGWGLAGPKFVDDVVYIQHVPDKLQLLYTNTVSHENCQKAMDYMTTNGWTLPPVQRDVEICAFHSPGHGMCNGDSGSALVSADSREQIGIVSWGLPCAVGAPDVFVRLSGVRGFVETHMIKYQDIKK